MTTHSDKAGRGYRVMVRSVHPRAFAWWNCMEFSWVIWNRRARRGDPGRIIGESHSRDDAWMDAALRMGL